MQLNAEDGLERRFVCIQLPELLLEGGEAHTDGCRSISDIGKECIRRAGEKIAIEWREKQIDNVGKLPLEDTDSPSVVPDTGFRVFKLDSSNVHTWDGSHISSENTDLFLTRAEHSLDNMKPDRRDTDMVYEVFIICTERYIEKANQSKGGVGFERMIITAAIASNTETSKFFPIIRCDVNEANSPPNFMDGRKFVDMRNGELFEEKIDELIRSLSDRPILGKSPLGRFEMPVIGKKCSFNEG